jgi:hypothetical protein
VGQTHALRHTDIANWAPLPSWPGLFMWTERKTPVHVEIEYSGADAQLHKVTTTIEPEVRASLVTLVIGSWVGAVLLAVFSLVHAQHRSAAGEEAKPVNALRLGIAGVVTGTIFILVIQRVGNLDLPFTFTVNDVIGAIVVGLLSFKLGDTLYKYFFRG